MERKSLFISVAGVCLLGYALALSSCRSDSNPTNSVDDATSYQMMKVERGSRVLQQSYSASIRGKQDVAILPQVGGTITEVCVQEGQHVSRGQRLFVIDQVPFQAALRTAEANVKAAEAGLATAKLNYESNQELFKQKVVSQHTLQTAQNAFLSAEAGLSQAQAALTNARNSLSYTEVKSPVSGQVGNLPYRAGALVSPQIPEPLTTVSDNSEMWVYFSMTELQLLSLSRQYGSMDEAVRQMPDVTLQLKDGSVYGESGRIESVSAVVDRMTGTVTCKAVFPNRSGLLHSGQSGSVLIPQTYSDVLIIPQSATMRQQDKVVVWKADVNGLAESVLIEVAPVNDGKEYMVTGGLTEGDEILASGAGLIRPGMKLK